MPRLYLLRIILLLFLVLTVGLPIQAQTTEEGELIPFNSALIGSDGYDYLLTKARDSLNFSYLTGYFSYPLFNVPGSGPRSIYEGPFYDIDRDEFTEFPVIGEGNTIHYSGSDEIPFTKFDENLGISYSKYFGGNGSDIATDILIDDQDRIFILGKTTSTRFYPNLPVTNEGFYDTIVLQINSTTSELISHFTFGGSQFEEANAIELLSDGSMIIVGSTNSPDFPLLNPVDDVLHPPSNETVTDTSSDIYITKFRKNGSMEFSTFLGGSSYERARDLLIDDNNNIYVAGFTLSNDFPTVNAENSEPLGNTDSVLVKMNQNGSLLQSTLFGGSGSDVINDITFDNEDRIIAVGMTLSRDFPISRAVGGIDEEINNSPEDGIFSDGFYTVMDNEFNIRISSYLGGSGSENLRSVDVDENNNIYITGSTKSPDYPIHGPFSRPPAYNGELLDVAEDGLPENDIVITKVTNEGRIAYSTFYGGYRSDVAHDVKFKTINGTSIASVNGYTQSADIPITGGRNNASNLDNTFIIDFEIPDGVFSSVAYPGKDNTTQLIILSILGGVSITLLGNYIYRRYQKKQKDKLRHDEYRESYDLIREAMREE